MTFPSPNLTVVLLSLVVGWAALFPLRRALGAAGYHLFAYPVGLVAWPLVSALTSLTGATYGLKAVAVTLIAYVAAGALGSRLIVRGRAVGRELPWQSWAAWGAAVGGVALALDLSGLTAGGYDSIFHYQSWGIWLHEVGKLTPDLVGAYNLLLPSLHAAVMAFGGDWLFVAFPVMSFNLLAILAWSLWRTLPSRIGRGWTVAIVLAACGLLASLTQYVYHTFYSHSHMASAFFFFGAVVAAREAYLGDRSGDASSARAFALVGGVCAAGFALVRTDGLAYVAAVLILLAVLETRAADGIKRLQAAYLGLFGVLGPVFAVAFIELGMWSSAKMTGRKALAVLIALGVIAAVTPLVAEWARRWLGTGRSLLGVLVGINVVGLLVLWSLRTPRFVVAVTNMVTNLSQKGAWGFVWYFVIGIIAVSVALRAAWRSDEWSDTLVFTIAQFMFIALAIHGLTHAGRIAPADSFNRLVFHILPVFFLYWGRFSGGLVDTLTRGRE